MKCSHPGFRMNVGCKECTIETCEAKLRTPKSLAQYLATISDMGVPKTEAFFKQVLEAYQSTENVTIEIERKA